MISIVIPTYNHCEKYLKPCIDSILEHTDLQDVELIVSANGCTDGTKSYLAGLKTQLGNQLKVIWHDKPLGYAKANNVAIPHAQGEHIVLLNNDTVLLPQIKNQWLSMLLKPFKTNPFCGISCVIKSHSEPAGRDFGIFFCVMIGKRVFHEIGLLNEDYGVGGGEDTEFCIEAENAGFQVIECTPKVWQDISYVGGFPIYHRGEGTMHDAALVADYNSIFHRNSLKLAKKYNLDWYRWKLSNHYERAVFLKGDAVFPRELTRYKWAAAHVRGTKVLEIGCSTGYGVQFLGDVDYLGLDYDPQIVEVAQEQGWSATASFQYADINNYALDRYDTIIAFEVIEHLDNGLEVFERLKQHGKTLLFTVPHKEPVGFWGPHHKLHGLSEEHFSGCVFHYIDEVGNITGQPRAIDEVNRCNLMIGCWHG